MAPEPETIRYEGIHCEFVIHARPPVVVMHISGSDIGEFLDAPMQALNARIKAGEPVDLFIDARNVRGASIEVSGDWAAWLSKHKPQLRSVTMLTGSRFIQVTAEFMRRFASLEGIMRICTEPEVFDSALAEAQKAR